MHYAAAMDWHPSRVTVVRNYQGGENNADNAGGRVIYFAFVSQQENPSVSIIIIINPLEDAFYVAEGQGYFEVVCAIWCPFKK